MSNSSLLQDAIEAHNHKHSNSSKGSASNSKGDNDSGGIAMIKTSYKMLSTKEDDGSMDEEEHGMKKSNSNKNIIKIKKQNNGKKSNNNSSMMHDIDEESQADSNNSNSSGSEEEKNILTEQDRLQHKSFVSIDDNNSYSTTGFLPLDAETGEEEEMTLAEYVQSQRLKGKKGSSKGKGKKKRNQMCFTLQDLGMKDEDDSDNDDNDEDHQQPLHPVCCFIWIPILITLIAILSEAIMSTISYTTEKLSLPSIFIAAILLPFISTGANHLEAIRYGLRNQIDYSLQMIMDSSTHLVLGVVPTMVFFAWLLQCNAFSLNFGAYESCCLILCVISTVFAIHDGISTWMLGLMLICSFIIMTIGFMVHRKIEY
jgi:hypothetical protein